MLCWVSRQAGGPRETKRQRTLEELTFQCTSEAGGQELTFQLDSGSQVGRMLFHVRAGQPLRSIQAFHPHWGEQSASSVPRCQCSSHPQTSQSTRHTLNVGPDSWAPQGLGTVTSR